MMEALIEGLRVGVFAAGVVIAFSGIVLMSCVIALALLNWLGVID